MGNLEGTKQTPRKTVHLIGNAHLDPVWYWRWTEGCAEALATCWSAVHRLREYPQFVVTRGEAQLYSWIERIDPELFREIQRYVREGRWHIVNGWWVQPDTMLPCGEAFVRQAVYGKQYFRDKFGVEPRVAYCVDSSPHALSLPQILQKSGYVGYVFMRPEPHEETLPSQVFWWEGIDGTRVLAYRLTGPYCTPEAPELEFFEEHFERSLQASPEAIPETMFFYGVGNHGGGPTKWQIERLLELQEERADLSLEFSHPEAYFDAVMPFIETLPIVAQELHKPAVGRYSAVSHLKQSNRAAENILLIAERWATLAWMYGGAVGYPQEDIRDAWQTLLFNQFHDILWGTSIREACEDALESLGEVKQTATRVLDRSVRIIATQIDTAGEGSPLIVFNPSSWEREEYIEFEPWLGRQMQDDDVLVDDKGQLVPFQRLLPSAAVDHIARIVFLAQVPALGYRVYWIRKDNRRPALPSLIGRDTTIETELLRLRIDPDTGAIASLYDKVHQREVFNGSGNLAQVYEDQSNTWGHGVEAFTEVIGHFGKAKCVLEECGPIRVGLRTESFYGSSRLTQRVRLYRNSPIVEVQVKVDWRERFKLLKLCYPVALNEATIAAEIPYGLIQRPCDGKEYPCHSYVDIRDHNHGLALINDGKYSYDARESTVGMTVVRSSIFAWHGSPLRDDRDYEFTDQGEHRFTLWLWPHTFKESVDIALRAHALNQPLYCTSAFLHKGSMPSQRSFLRVNSKSVELAALKKAEGEEAVVMRLVETSGQRAEAIIEWDTGESQEIILEPNEIRTIIFRKGAKKGEVCDLLERTL